MRTKYIYTSADEPTKGTIVPKFCGCDVDFETISTIGAVLW